MPFAGILRDSTPKAANTSWSTNTQWSATSSPKKHLHQKVLKGIPH